MTDTNDTERNDDGSPDPLAYPTGPRYTGNQRILDLEDELREEGVDIANPARPLASSTATVEELRAEITAEADTDDPDRQRIAALNRQLNALKDGDKNE